MCCCKVIDIYSPITKKLKDEGWLVPDGYFSDDEGVSGSDAEEEEDGAEVDGKRKRKPKQEEAGEQNSQEEKDKGKDKVDDAPNPKNNNKGKVRKPVEPKLKALVLSAIGPIFCMDESGKVKKKANKSIQIR